MAGAPFPGAASGFGCESRDGVPGREFSSRPVPGGVSGSGEGQARFRHRQFPSPPPTAAAENLANAYGTGLGVRPAGTPAAADERELKRQRRAVNRERPQEPPEKQAECEELGSRVGSLTEENEAQDGGEASRGAVPGAQPGQHRAPRLRRGGWGQGRDGGARAPSGPTEEEKKMAAAAGAKAAAEAMEAAKGGRARGWGQR